MGLRILFALLFDTFLLLRVQSATFRIRNNCPSTIWPATLSGSGSQPLPSTGFELASKGSTTINVPAPWSGRVWARSHCTNTTNGRFTCGTGDCASQQVACNGAGGIPPATLIEFTIAASGGKDFYDVSLVDGFNLPVSLIPEGQSGCGATSCPVDLNGQCPMELAIKDKSGSTIGCKSACFAFNQPEYCCTGGYNSPDTCKPSSYSLFFKERCPKAYSYAYDDKISIFTCSAGANYLITFCP